MTDETARQLNAGFAEELRCRRRGAGLRQRDLAEAVGVNPTVVSRWENGTRYPTREQARALAAHFGCTVADLDPLLTEVR